MRFLPLLIALVFGSFISTAKAVNVTRTGPVIIEIIQASASVKIDMSTATTTQVIAAVGGQNIYITSWDVIAGGTGNFKLVYGTGTNCATGTTDLTGAYNLTAQAGIAKGNGLGPVLTAPVGVAVCVVNSAPVQMSGSIAYTQY